MTNTAAYKFVRKIVLTVFGGACLLVGLVMWPLPTPFGIPLLMLGLVTLSAEYHWPRHAIGYVKRVPEFMHQAWLRVRAGVGVLGRKAAAGRSAASRFANIAPAPPRMAPEED